MQKGGPTCPFRCLVQNFVEGRRWYAVIRLEQFCKQIDDGRYVSQISKLLKYFVGHWSRYRIGCWSRPWHSIYWFGHVTTLPPFVRMCITLRRGDDLSLTRVPPVR
jgi:hypothetical protein